MTIGNRLGWSIEWSTAFRGNHSGIVIEQNDLEIVVIESDYNEEYTLPVASCIKMKPALDQYIILKTKYWEIDDIVNADSSYSCSRSKLIRIIDEIGGISDTDEAMIKQREIKLKKLALELQRHDASLEDGISYHSSRDGSDLLNTCSHDSSGKISRSSSSQADEKKCYKEVEDRGEGDEDINDSSDNESDDGKSGDEREEESESDEATHDENEDEDESASGSENESESESESGDSEEDDDDEEDEDEEEETIDVKITILDSPDVRGFSVPTLTGFDIVMQQLEIYYGSRPKLSYRDNEGDKVAVLATSDFQYVVRAHKSGSEKGEHARTMRLTAEFRTSRIEKTSSDDLIGALDEIIASSPRKKQFHISSINNQNNQNNDKNERNSERNERNTISDCVVRERKFVCVNTSPSDMSEAGILGGRMESSEVLWQRGDLLGE